MNKLGYWLLRCENQLLTTIDCTAGNIFPRGLASDFGNPQNALMIGEHQGIPCYAAEVEMISDNIPGVFMPVRSLISLGCSAEVYLAGRAIHLLDWQRNHQYCGKCGTPTIHKSGEFAKICSACNLIVYPRISPAVMVLITRGKEILLARSPHFKPGVFSALAGFVEAGETLEQCAFREVREEVKIEISNLRYFGSQSWPFPNSLMVAFFADYEGGVITPDPLEIEDANWFLPGQLPSLPEPASLARKIIDAACGSLNSQ